MNDVMDPCGQWKVLRLSIRLLRTLNGGLRPPSGIPDFDLENIKQLKEALRTLRLKGFDRSIEFRQK